MKPKRGNLFLRSSRAFTSGQYTGNRLPRDLVSISPTFYEQLFRENPFTKKLQTQIVSTEKLRKNIRMKKLLVKDW
jgi:hypothetical protein